MVIIWFNDGAMAGGYFSLYVVILTLLLIAQVIKTRKQRRLFN